jgi:TetR/AcrR family transcriptional regulator, regulator of cefoperazone and chloramphenicol sensitivity
VNIAAVNYHFGGKLRLFKAVLDHAANRGGVVQGVPHVSRAQSDMLNTLRDQVAAILAAIHGDGPDSWLWRITAREAGGPQVRVGLVRVALSAELAALADAIERALEAKAGSPRKADVDRTLTAIVAICLNWNRVGTLLPSATAREAATGDTAAALTCALLTMHAPSSQART